MVGPFFSVGVPTALGGCSTQPRFPTNAGVALLLTHVAAHFGMVPRQGKFRIRTPAVPFRTRLEATFSPSP